MTISRAIISEQTAVDTLLQPASQDQNLTPTPSVFAHRKQLRQLEKAAAEAVATHFPTYLAAALPRTHDFIKLAPKQQVKALALFFKIMHEATINTFMDQRQSGRDMPTLSLEAKETADTGVKLGHQIQRTGEANPVLKHLTDYYAALLFMTARRDNPRTAFAAACLVLERFEQPRAPRKPTADPWPKIFARLPPSAAND